MYIVRDLDKGTEQACLTLTAARYVSLSIERGVIVRARLRTDLGKTELRCALFNRDGYAAEIVVIAEISNGIARKIAT